MKCASQPPAGGGIESPDCGRGLPRCAAIYTPRVPAPFGRIRGPRRPALPLLLFAAVLLCACERGVGSGSTASGKPAGGAALSATDGPTTPRTAETRVFIVLDTVRADHTSMCGYERPTSPFLASLAKRATAKSCRAYSPGSWTAPSHASFFTGLPVEEHGTTVARERGTQLPWGARCFPLDERFPTLAEQLGARGFQTVLVSANPVVGEVTGLARGFQTVAVAEQWGELRGARLAERLRKVLSQQARDEPLFLFVNIIDAHVPYGPIPAGVGWVPQRPGFDVNWNPASVQYRYVAGEASEEEVEAFRSHYVDSYDYAVHTADRTLEQVMAVLEGEGWLGEHYRVVITSDHGEFLADHGLVVHGKDIWEQVVRVPFVYLASEDPLRIEAPWSAINAYHLMMDEPPEQGVASAMAFPDTRMARLFQDRDPRHGSFKLAEWRGEEKATWALDTFSRFDLASDPGETNPTPLPDDDPLKARLERGVGQARALLEREDSFSDSLLKKLQALGYVD